MRKPPCVLFPRDFPPGFPHRSFPGLEEILLKISKDEPAGGPSDTWMPQNWAQCCEKKGSVQMGVSINGGFHKWGYDQLDGL